MLNHGGGLIRAAVDFSIPVEQWLDLSTGINPNGWPVSELPAQCWQRLPETDDGLNAVAREYYQAKHVLPVAGSQAAIQQLPKLRSPCRVAIPSIGYAEHRKAWQDHKMVLLDTEQVFNQVDNLDVVMLINPNNPSGELIERSRLLELHKKLHEKGGWLIIDEAFMDADPTQSLAEYSDQTGLIILRSVGKFFGLAGIRAGFVLAEQSLLIKMEEQLGPWSVSGPARWICREAFVDQGWQVNARTKLFADSAYLSQILRNKYNQLPKGSALFKTVLMKDAALHFKCLAAQGILVRLLDNQSGLRFGLPASLAGFNRLEKALSYKV